MFTFPLLNLPRGLSPRAQPATLQIATLTALALAAISLAALQTSAAAQAQAPAPPRPSPDVILFTNGDQLSGTLLRGIGDSVVFKSDMAGEITVPLAKIKELRSSGSFAVLRKNAPVTRAGVEPGTIQVQAESIQVATPKGHSETIPIKELGFIIDQPTYDKELKTHASLLHGWNGAITAGATLVRATQTGTSFTAGIAASRAIPAVPYLPRRDRTLFNLIESYGKLTQPVIPQTVPIPTPPSIAKTNIFHTDLEQDRYFSARFYALGTVAFDHNFSQGLDLQQVYGAGFGWTPIQTPKQQLDLTANIHYEKQAFQQSANDQNLIGATIADAYLRHLPGKLIFTQTASFLPAFNNSNAYSANFAAGLALPVFHRLSVSFNTSDNYLNNPSAGYKKNSYQFVTGLTYTLH